MAERIHFLEKNLNQIKHSIPGVIKPRSQDLKQHNVINVMETFT